MSELWMRLDVDYDRAKWLRRQPRAIRNAWVDLLRAVKKEAPKKGYMRFRDVDDLALTMRYDEADDIELLTTLLDAAQLDMDGTGAAVLIEGGYLYIVKWAEYQSTEAERSRRRRNGQTTDEPVIPGPAPQGPSGVEPHDDEKADTFETVKTRTTVSNDVRPDSLSCATSNQLPVDSSNPILSKELKHVAPEGAESVPGKGVAFDEAKYDVWFKKFQKTYPPRKGQQNWPKTKDTLRRKFKQGLAPKTVMRGAERALAFYEADGKLRTPFVPMSSTWVNGRGWDDEYPVTLVVETGGATKSAAQMRAEMVERARLADGGR